MANFADLWEQTPINKMAGLKGDIATSVTGSK